MITKICPKCRERKALTYFSKNSSRANGVNSYCVSCNEIYHRNYYRQLKLRMFGLFGNKCESCGTTDPRVLEVNHRNGGGSKERSSKGHWTLYLELVHGKRDIVDFNLLCANCNILHEYNQG